MGDGGEAARRHHYSPWIRASPGPSAVADLHVPIRAGSDIAFLGGIVRYVIENQRYFREYVVTYTNAPAIISEDYRDTEDLDGLFSGWDSEKNQYDLNSWAYEGTSATPAGCARSWSTSIAGLERFVDSPTLARIQNACERRGLPQRRHAFTIFDEQCQQLFQGKP